MAPPDGEVYVVWKWIEKQAAIGMWSSFHYEGEWLHCVIITGYKDFPLHVNLVLVAFVFTLQGLSHSFHHFFLWCWFIYVFVQVNHFAEPSWHITRRLCTDGGFFRHYGLHIIVPVACVLGLPACTGMIIVPEEAGVNFCACLYATWHPVLSLLRMV